MNLKALIKQFMKFGIVGVIAFLIDFGTMVALTELLGINPVVSAGFSYCVSTVFNYLASMRYVFRHRDDLSRTHEFIIFIENFESEEKLKKDLEKFLSYQVGMHEVNASIGISILNKDATTFNRLFKHADEALYVAKKSKEKIAFYDPSMR